MASSSDLSRAVSEADRLHALAACEVFGVVGIEGLDELVALAARLVGTPVAAVNLIGKNRQWTVAGVGLPAGDAARDTSLCDFAIAQDDATVIEDLCEDARFAGHPKVADGIRFYAGFPLLSEEGLAVGAFCVADVRPRVLKDDQLLSLRAVACAAAAQIDARRHVAAARDAGERLQAVIDHAPDAFVSMDSDGRITEWNFEAQRMFGWTREEACGTTVSELVIPPELRDAHKRGLTRYLSTRQSGMLNRPIEVAAVTKSAHMLAVELTIAATGEGTAVCFNAFIRDISERKAAEAVLRASERRLAEAQHVGGVGSFEWDIESNVVSWSDELCRIAGVAPGEHSTDLAGFIALVYEEDRARIVDTTPVHLDDRARLRADFEASLRSGTPLDSECRIVRPDGTVRTTQTLGEVVRDEQGAPLRMVGTVQDVTERYEAERIKDEFISIVSHELRTPLTSIRGSLGLLESGMLGALPAQGQRMVEIAVKNTDRLVRLINDILDIERIESGQIDMHPVSCDGSELIEQAAEALTSVAAAADITVVTLGEPVRLSADPDRVIQTLTNLIANAVKFSPPRSSVEVSCSPRDEDVLFEVRDQGRGIPPENLESIFGRFAQVDASDSREKGGTGLGLAICRSIVEQHGGRIWAHSDPGHGTTLSFTLPAPPSSRVKILRETQPASVRIPSGGRV